MTGHLVFTTVHTNDAISSIIRLIDMGIEPFLVASSVVAIVAQRLVRRICPVCAASSQPVELQIPWTGETRRIGRPPKAVGCDECSNTGYKGRIGLYEMIVVDPKQRLAVSIYFLPDSIDAIFVPKEQSPIVKPKGGIIMGAH